MPFLEDALNPDRAQAALRTVMPEVRRVMAARLMRHKPGKRALIAYELETAAGSETVLGKIRAKGLDDRSYQLQRALWQHGWDAHSTSGFSVPEPLGIIPMWHLWLQRWVPGSPATASLTAADGVALAARIAALAHHLHQTPMPTAKPHTLADELRILRDRVPQAAVIFPALSPRIRRILAACEALAHDWATVLHAQPTGTWFSPVGIHRDFYGDQVIVMGDRLWLLDLDLYCQGHPALDMGNFIAHITEFSLREWGDPAALVDREAALTEAAIALWQPNLAISPQVLTQAIEGFVTLTLVRHIHISTRIVARRSQTAAIVALCERRLAPWLASG